MNRSKRFIRMIESWNKADELSRYGIYLSDDDPRDVDQLLAMAKAGYGQTYNPSMFDDKPAKPSKKEFKNLAKKVISKFNNLFKGKLIKLKTYGDINTDSIITTYATGIDARTMSEFRNKMITWLKSNFNETPNINGNTFVDESGYIKIDIKLNIHNGNLELSIQY